MWLKKRFTDRAFDKQLSDHRLTYKPGGSTLVVSFDNAARPFEGDFKTREIWGERFYQSEGHSILGVIARTPDWFRNQNLITELENLASSGFFDRFDKVFLTGGSMGGFAACAFASLVPGCTVLAISPQISVDPARVPWERRFPKATQQNWTLPYSDAARGMVAAGRTYIVFDPLDHTDHRHIRMIGDVPGLQLLQVPAGGHDVSLLLHQANILKPYTRAAIDGTLTEISFRKMIAHRKECVRYRRVLVRHAIHRGHYQMAARVAQLSEGRFPNADFKALRTTALAAADQLPEAMKLLFPNDADNKTMGRPAAKPRCTTIQRQQKKDTALSDQPKHRFDARFPNLKRNIFIVTYGRTGSTLLQSLLMTVPGCHMLGENHNAMESILHAAGRIRMTRQTWGKQEQPPSFPWYGADNVKPVMFANGMIDSFVHHVLVPRPDCRYFGFKEIRYNALGDRFAEMLDFMRFHFKDALFIFNTRNVDDVANSAWWKNWEKADVEQLVRHMDQRFADYHAAHPDFTMMTSYEQFSTDPTALKPLFDLLQEPFDQAAIEEVLATRLTH